MTAKINASRRATFLTALRATGNQTLAAERAKVSSSWVQAQHERGLALACGSFDKLRMSGGFIQPGKGWGFLNGAELVIKGTGGAALGPGGGDWL